MAVITPLKGVNQITIDVSNNPARAAIGTDKVQVYLDQNGKIVSMGETLTTGLAGTEIDKGVFSREKTIEVANSIKDQLNPQLKALGYSEYTTANAIVADADLFKQRTEQVVNDRKNNDKESFNFRNRNTENVAALVSKTKPETSGVIVFPTDLIVSSGGGSVSYSQDTIRIKALKYVPPQQDFLKGKRNAEIYSEGLGSNNQILNLEQGYDYKGEVILPMPLSIRDAVGAEWGVGALNTLALGVFSAIRDKYENGAGGNVGTLLRTGFKNFQATEAWIALADAYAAGGGGAGNLRTQVLNDVTAEIAGKIGLQVDPLQVLARSTGSVVNNNAELLFRGPKLRSFDFSWKLSPRSSEDSRRIRQLIRFFKLNSLPYVKSDTIFIETPNVFVVQYVKSDNQRNEALPQPKICALLDFRVDYTPDGVGWAAYGDDSQPVTSVISAVFHELTPLFANEYAGLPEDSVGF